MQNLVPALKISVLLHELLYYFLLLDAVQSSYLHFMHHNWKSSPVNLGLFAYYDKLAVVLLQLLLCFLHVGCYHNIPAGQSSGYQYFFRYVLALLLVDLLHQSSDQLGVVFWDHVGALDNYLSCEMHQNFVYQG